MITIMSPIDISQFSDCVIYTQWRDVCTPDSVATAYRALETMLDNSGSFQHVVLDLSEKPAIPLVQALAETLNLTYHRRVAAWYIVGKSAAASSLIAVLQKMDEAKPAFHFTDADAAFSFLTDTGSVANQ